MSTKKDVSMRTVLRNANFRFLWIGQVLSNLGDGMNNLALLVLIQRLTGSTMALATMAVLAALPRIIIGPLAGVYVDRWSRKRVMIVSDLLRGFIVLGYILVRHPEQVKFLYLLGFLEASASTFFTPARSALLPNLLREEELLTANSLSQTTQVLMSLLGMAVAGGIIGLSNRYWPAFLFASFTFFASMFLVQRIRVVEPPRGSAVTATVADVWREIKEGVNVIVHSRVLIGVLMAAGVSVLGLGAANILIVPFLLEDMHLAPVWFSVAQGATTVGMIISGSLVTLVAARLRPTSIVTLTLMGLGLSIGLMSHAQYIWQVLAFLFVAGWCVTPLNASISTLFQTVVSDEVRGRVGASLNMLVTTGNITSMALSGMLADMWGVRNVFLLAGGFSLLAALTAHGIFRGTGASPSVVPGD